MKVNTQHFQSVNWDETRGGLLIIDQTLLPHRFEQRLLTSLADCCEAIISMRVRGAPLIGVVAAYGVVLAMAEDSSDAALASACEQLLATRPTAVNLRWAVHRVQNALQGAGAAERPALARQLADEIHAEDVATCNAIGEHGLDILREIYAKKLANFQTHVDTADQAPVLNILTHCNAGWLATVDWGTALAPIFKAHEAGIPVHVWVDETRPRLQGALTAWELGHHGVPHTLIADNAGGHLMQTGAVDLCLVGSDRTAANGDVCNKIGTYLKALAAADNHLPFYVALPVSTIDWQLPEGVGAVPIEERDAAELQLIRGQTANDSMAAVAVFPEHSAVANPAFDVTPARLVTALITEYGVYAANREALQALWRDIVDKPSTTKPAPTGASCE